MPRPTTPMLPAWALRACLWASVTAALSTPQTVLSPGPLVPPDTLGQLDDWKPLEASDGPHSVLHRAAFVLVFCFIGLGALTRTRDLLEHNRADGLRRICFMLLLPAFLLRHIWLCPLDAQLSVVVAWSFGLHCLWCALSVCSAWRLEPFDRQARGWTMLMSQGAMNSFLYPLLLSHEEFGERALACAVLWDLAGNMWICQLVLFALAAFFRPSAGEVERLEDVLAGVRTGCDPLENASLLRPDAPGGVAWRNAMPSAEPLEVLTTGDADGASPSLSLSLPPPKVISDILRSAALRGEVQEIAREALSQPVLICCVGGLCLNLLRVPCPALVDWPLWLLGEPYKVVLYFLVGFYGADGNHLRSSELALLGRALLLRSAIAVVIVGLASVTLPVDTRLRQTLALAGMSPVSSFVLHLVSEHRYGEAMIRLTVVGGFASTILSTVFQNLFMVIFEAAS